MNIYAFPSGHDPKTGTAQFGMNLRDYFAAKAMAALMTGCFVGESDEVVAKAAYETADAMMKAREV